MKELSIEEKQLLLKDLCTRLPYKVKVDIIYNKEHGSSDRLRICSEGCLTLNTDVLGLYIENEIYLKPYLRPISYMTEEERKEYKHLVAFSGNPEGSVNFVDWLNKKMFAYRTIDGKDMFELNLALVAPEGMYETT